MSDTITATITAQQQLSQKFFELLTKLRETKGQENQTLDYISQVLNLTQTQIAKLFFEKAFVYQHLVMSHTDVGNNLKLMEQSALDAHDIIVKHNLTDLLGDDLRFLGRVYDYNHDYPQAHTFYLQALDFYKKQNHPRVLEINAFICANLINQNKIDEGLSLAQKTYADFDQIPLKQSDFYTWAVWKTGIYPRIVKALINQKVNFDHNEIKNILQNDQKLLTSPNYNFCLRLDEIIEALNLLN